jgi:hypothetical protein
MFFGGMGRVGLISNVSPERNVELKEIKIISLISICLAQKFKFF